MRKFSYGVATYIISVVVLAPKCSSSHSSLRRVSTLSIHPPFCSEAHKALALYVGIYPTLLSAVFNQCKYWKQCKWWKQCSQWKQFMGRCYLHSYIVLMLWTSSCTIVVHSQNKNLFQFEATYYCFCSEKGCNGNLEKSGELSLLPDLRWTHRSTSKIYFRLCSKRKVL